MGTLYITTAGEAVPEVYRYVMCHGVTELIVTMGNSQQFPYMTCAYHAVAFLNFASSYRRNDGLSLNTAFFIFLKGNADECVINCVKQILSEFSHNIGLKVNQNCKAVLPASFLKAKKTRKRNENQ